MKRLARLKIERAVLDLQGAVGAEWPVEPRELDVSALGGVGVNIFVINERAPDDVAAVRRERVGQHVGSLGMRAAVRFRSGLSLGVCFDEKPAEIGNEFVNLVGLCFPPISDFLIERISGREPT